MLKVEAVLHRWQETEVSQLPALYRIRKWPAPLQLSMKMLLFPESPQLYVSLHSSLNGSSGAELIEMSYDLENLNGPLVSLSIG